MHGTAEPSSRQRLCTASSSSHDMLPVSSASWCRVLITWHRESESRPMFTFESSSPQTYLAATLWLSLSPEFPSDPFPWSDPHTSQFHIHSLAFPRRQLLCRIIRNSGRWQPLSPIASVIEPRCAYSYRVCRIDLSPTTANSGCVATLNHGFIVSLTHTHVLAATS